MGDVAGTVLEEIRDPEAGLALLAKRPDQETPQSRTLRRFWTFVFEGWRDGLAGDTLGFMRALLACNYCGKPPPRGLVDAMIAQASKLMSPEEQQDQVALARHKARWEAMQAELDKGLSLERSSAAASESLARSDARGEPRSLRESHRIIKKAGGARATLLSYRRARPRP
jgi:hypothetical protein